MKPIFLWAGLVLGLAMVAIGYLALLLCQYSAWWVDLCVVVGGLVTFQYFCDELILLRRERKHR